MKILALTTAILLASNVGAYADQLSNQAEYDISAAKPVPVLVRGEPVTPENVHLLHIHMPEVKEGDGSIGKDFSNYKANHKTIEEGANQSGVDDGMQLVHQLKNTAKNNLTYTFLLALKTLSPMPEEVLYHTIVIQDLESIKNSLRVLSGQKAEQMRNDQGLHLPSASFKAVLLRGVMTHGGNSETLTMAVTSNIVDPTNHTYTLKGCRILADAYGDLSTLRVQIKPKEIVCQDSKTGEWLGSENISGYVAGSDGVQGLRAKYKLNKQEIISWEAANNTLNSQNLNGAQAADQLAKTYTNKVKILSPVLVLHAGMKASVYLTKSIVLKPIDSIVGASDE